MADNVVRKRATRKVAKKTVARKAPTQVASVSPREGRTMMPFVAIGIFLVVVGASVAIGYSDSGPISVENTINDKRVNGTEEEKAALENIPVQRKRPSAPNGGLVPSKDGSVKAPAPAAVETVASSTATTTDEVTEEDAEVTDETGDVNEEAQVEASPDEAPAEEGVQSDPVSEGGDVVEESVQ